MEIDSTSIIAFDGAKCKYGADASMRGPQPGRQGKEQFFEVGYTQSRSS